MCVNNMYRDKIKLPYFFFIEPVDASVCLDIYVLSIFSPNDRSTADFLCTSIIFHVYASSY